MNLRQSLRQKHNAVAEANVAPRPGRKTANNASRNVTYRPSTRPAVSVDTYRNDPLYPKIVRAVAGILQTGKVVAPVDVLIRMDLLAPERLEDWRRGRVPYLEKVIICNLTRLSRLLRILRFHAHDLRLVPSITVYMKWGKGPKKRLRFTKTGDSKLEEAYSRHFVWPGKGPFHPPAPWEKQPPGPETRQRDKTE
ncbi:MAG: hypothetical protein JXA30_11440 [Deltaproteobacteria bacterium]|nr:hypothetical protein [Deltaproteobacteria bacterium]